MSLEAPSLKQLCFNSLDSSSLCELTNKMEASTGSFHYWKNPIKPGNTDENIIAKAVAKAEAKRPKDLPRLFLRNFNLKIKSANSSDEVEHFFRVFKRRFFKTDDRKYTKSVTELLQQCFFSWRFFSEDFEFIKILIKTGINPNVQFLELLSFKPTKATILHYAFDKGYPAAAIEWFFNNGVSASEKNSDGKLPFFHFLERVHWYEPQSATEILSLFVKQKECLTYNGKGISSLEYLFERFTKPPSRDSLSTLAVVEEMLKQFGWQARPHQHQLLALPCQLDELIKRLQSTDFPSGYTLLKKRIEFDNALVEEGLKAGEFTVFENTDIEIVSDKQADPLQLHQVSHSEAAACQALYEQIKNGKTCFQWQNDKYVREQVLTCIKKLLTRPSGRALIYLLVQSNYPLFIIENRENNGSCVVVPTQNQLPRLISIDFSKNFHLCCINGEGKKEGRDNNPTLRLGHELLHASLRAMDTKAAEELLKIKTKDPDWSNLNEQFVIAGVGGENLLCENMLRFEFGELARWSHSGFKKSP